MRYLIAKKIGMTQLFDENGRVAPATLLQADSVQVTQVITAEKNGYNAVQVGSGRKKANKPLEGHFGDLAKDGFGFSYVREFRTESEPNIKRGDALTVDQFTSGDKVSVRGITKGKGFQGVVKRWNFSGAPKTHGTKDTLRGGGAIGGAFPQRVRKGVKMAGRMGGVRKTVLNLKIVHVDKDRNVLAVRGAVPGNRGSFVELWAPGVPEKKESEEEKKKKVEAQ